ncbi:MAG: hypothetical protein ACTS4U_00800 [Candidatus Hodgkinia cicadicola]
MKTKPSQISLCIPNTSNLSTYGPHFTLNHLRKVTTFKCGQIV